MWSPSPFEIGSDGTVRYIRNSWIRQVAVYNDEIEYDIKFRTNNWGFVDTIDYGLYDSFDPAIRRVAFVGDSLGTGEGGYMWVSDLRQKVIFKENKEKKTMFYNFSVSGGNINSFFETLKSVSREMSFTDIIILAITEDLERINWRPLTYDSKLYYCPKNFTQKECLKCWYVSAAYMIDYNADREQILMKVNGIRLRNNSDNYIKKMGVKNKIVIQIKEVLLKSFFLRILKNIFVIAREQIALSKKKVDLTPLFKIRKLFPEAKIYFMHIPLKDEIISGRYKINIGEQVQSSGITYVPLLNSCRWSKDMFPIYDKHPNSLGYRNIEDCIEKYLLGTVLL